MVNKIFKYMLEPDKLTKKLEAKLSKKDGEKSKEKEENPELLIDDDGNVSLNFENEEVYKAFNDHLDTIEAQEVKAKKKTGKLETTEVAA